MKKMTRKKAKRGIIYKKIFSVIAAITLIVGSIPISTLVASAETSNIALADKKIEILLSSETGGALTTDGYKQQLLEKLVAKGYSEDNIRFIDSVDTIKTGNLGMGWNDYDHLNYNETMTSDTTVYTSVTDTSTAEVKDRDRHIYSLNGGKEMTFLGYGVPGYKDFAIYPSDSSDTKIVNFDISADKVDTHTLEGSGFLVNAGVDSNGILKAYLLFYKFATPTTGTVYLTSISYNASNIHESIGKTTMINGFSTSVTTGIPFTINSTSKRINVNMVVSQSNIACAYAQYTVDGAGAYVKGTDTSLFNYAIPAGNQTGYNGFGPLVSYTSHGCNILTMFTFSNLSMKVNTLPNNALNQTSWSSDKNVSKYYVNITDQGLSVNGNKDDILTNVIDKSVYYIGAGNTGTTAQTDANSIKAYTAGSSFVETNPGTNDAVAIQAIVDIISGVASNTPVTPLVVKNITVTDINTVDEKRIVKVADPTPGVDGPAFFEIVYQDTDGTEKVITVPGVDNGDNTIDVLLPTQVLDKDWFVIRLPLDPDHPAPTQSKLISNSDIVEPVVDFSVVNHATTNQVITYNMKNGSVILDINDISYSKSAVVLEGNSTTTYKIEAPDGTTVSTIGSIALDSGTAMNGDYKFTTVISVTDGGNTTNYSVTKKITIINDTTAPSATLKTTALNGSSISVAKTITVAMEDKESGIASYAIVVKPTNTAPDINSVSLQPVIISDSAYKEVSFTSSLISATNYIYAIVKDNSDNVTIKLLDSYIVPASVAALAAINNATTVLEMSNAIDLNATVLGLDLTAYNLLTDKSAVQDQLIPSTFGNATLLKTIFDQLVADQKVVEFNALKNSTQSELDAVYASYSKLDYYDADWAILQDAYTTASQNITNATNASELTTAKTNGVSAMAAVKTVNQTIEDAITEINNATTESYMSVLITKYADMMDLDLSGYNVVEDKKPVLTELITLTFTSKEQVKAAIIQAVDTQDKKQILADRIAIVKTYVDTTDEKKVASTDKVNIITQLNEVNSILSNGTYLSDKQKEDLNQQKVIFEGYITTINEVQKDLDNAKKIAATVDVEYISTLTKPELEVMATVIANRLADKSNLTQEEIAILTEAGNKLNKAIIVEIKKQESPINIPKDSSVLILEKQIEDLPNAVTSSDKIIKDNESAIMNAKETYDLLGTKKTQVSAELVLKLDQLIDRLSNINVKLDSTKAGTNVSATGLGLLVTRADVESGKDINITLNVVSKTALQPEKDTIVILTENKVIGAYFDINIYKQVGTSDPVRIGELDNQVCISIEIPDNIKGKLGYSIVRVHNGVPEILVSTQVGDILSFYTDKFSTYAIIYNEEIVIAPATAPLGAPQTGDNHGPIVLWVLTSAFVFGGLEITRRRNIKVPFSDEK